ncbi:hypothetical protein K0M31_017325 [Melipona bicolor]|uniref:Uncharacterized protein n=1 Tax=Melipona bicolor TaxID=60889 RepID=A0AA40KSE9_9HYME|nr:hypothetical protein K0M31_017325 [Melipona bicolor]
MEKKTCTILRGETTSEITGNIKASGVGGFIETEESRATESEEVFSKSDPSTSSNACCKGGDKNLGDKDEQEMACATVCCCVGSLWNYLMQTQISQCLEEKEEKNRQWQEEKEAALEYAASVRRLRRKPIVRDNAESVFFPQVLNPSSAWNVPRTKKKKKKGKKENKTTVPELHDPKAMSSRNYFANARTSTVPSDLDRSGTTERNNRLLRRPAYLGWKLKPARSTIAERRGGMTVRTLIAAEWKPWLGS